MALWLAFEGGGHWDSRRWMMPNDHWLTKLDLYRVTDDSNVHVYFYNRISHHAGWGQHHLILHYRFAESYRDGELNRTGPASRAARMKEQEAANLNGSKSTAPGPGDSEPSS